jgi:ATP-dependent helicase HrpA
MTGVLVPYDAWNVNDISPHLLMNFRVIDHDGSVVDQGRDLQAIKDALANDLDDVSEMSDETEQDTTCHQDDVGPDIIDTLPEIVELEMQGVYIKAYPALVKDGRQVNLRALQNKKPAQYETARALRQLVINALPEQVKHLKRSLPDIQNLCLKYTDFGSCDELKQDIIDKTIDDVFISGGIHSAEEFEHKLEQGRGQLHEKAEQWSQLLTRILDGYRALKKLTKNPTLAQLEMVADIQQQLAHLFPKNFITVIDREWLEQYPRYLAGIDKRVEKSKTNMTRDRQLKIEFSRLWDEYIKRQKLLEKQHIDSEQLSHYRWMLEEYRISLFAQELKTRFPVSDKRLRKYWNELSDV